MYSAHELPRRPALSPALYALIAVLAVERCMLREGAWGFAGVSGKAASGAGCVLLAAGLLGTAWRRRLSRGLRHRGYGSSGDETGGAKAAPLCLAVGTAALLAATLTSTVLVRGERFAEELGRVPLTRCEVRLLGNSSKGERAYRARAWVVTPGGAAGDVWLQTSGPFARGERLRCVGSFRPNGDDDWGSSSRMQGVWGSVNVRLVLGRERPGGVLGALGDLRDRVVESIAPTSGPVRALLAACVCGHKDEIRAQGLDKTFARCGMSHMVAVSGSHLAVLTSILGALLTGVGLRPRLRVPLLLGCSLLFVLFCGMPISAVRAWAMASVASVGTLLGRRGHALSGVSVVALAMALADPALSGQVAFLLSVSATSALSVYAAYATYAVTVLAGSRRLPRTVPAGARRRFAHAEASLYATVGASTVALVATAPLSAATFGTLSLAGPAANAVLSVPFSVFMVTGLVAAALFWAPGAQRAALGCSDLVGTALLRAMGRFAELPATEVPVGDGRGCWGSSWRCRQACSCFGGPVSRAARSCARSAPLRWRGLSFW